MRLSPERIAEITGCKRKRAQTAWFKLHLCADVPCDKIGPILSETSYELLLEKKLGIGASSSLPMNRPAIRPRKAA